MTLQVPFDSFLATVERMLGVTEIFLTPHAGGALATAASKARDTIVAAVTPLPFDVARARFQGSKFTIFEGAWTLSDAMDLACESTEPFIAAVAYRSDEGRPGIWVDAYPSLPAQVQVLRTMYDEFRQTGEVADVTFEEFVRIANPNTVILSPSDLRSFVAQKTPTSQTLNQNEDTETK